MKALSGGERNRLLLARLFTRPANVLVLDEPTNDLDLETLELLEEQLVEWPGTLLLVSHDRAFLDNVVTSTFVFEGDGRVQEYVGGYEDWVRQRLAEKSASVAEARKARSTPRSRPASRSRSRRRPRSRRGARSCRSRSSASSTSCRRRSTRSRPSSAQLAARIAGAGVLQGRRRGDQAGAGPRRRAAARAREGLRPLGGTGRAEGLKTGDSGLGTGS